MIRKSTRESIEADAKHHLFVSRSFLDGRPTTVAHRCLALGMWRIRLAASAMLAAGIIHHSFAIR
jgi:hypothetical protein